MPPHGYIHVLSLTDKIAEFRSAIQKQKISGNIDTPEGGFDAMLQAAVCQVRENQNQGWQMIWLLIDWHNSTVLHCVQVIELLLPGVLVKF